MSFSRRTDLIQHRQSASTSTQADFFPPRGLPDLPPSIPSSRTSAAQPLEDRAHSNDTFAVELYGTTQQQRATGPTGSECLPCPICGTECRRKQELARHHSEVHESKNRCPFCPMEWNRAYKIRDHLKVKHPDSFSTEIWNKINALRAKDLVVFLKSFTLFRDELVTAGSRAPSDPSLY